MSLFLPTCSEKSSVTEFIPPGFWHGTRYLKEILPTTPHFSNFQSFHRACIQSFSMEEKLFHPLSLIKLPCHTAFITEPSYAKQHAKHSTLDSPKYSKNYYWPNFVSKETTQVKVPRNTRVQDSESGLSHSKSHT